MVEAETELSHLPALRADTQRRGRHGGHGGMAAVGTARVADSDGQRRCKRVKVMRNGEAKQGARAIGQGVSGGGELRR